IRQPVIAQFLENVLTNKTRSSASITSKNEGARGPSPYQKRAYVSSAMTQSSCWRASPSNAIRSARVAFQPVGLLGETTNSARVLGVPAAASRSRSSDQPSFPNDIGTSTARAPTMPDAAAAFGQVGVGINTSSPAPATMAITIWIACMPEPVT